MSIYSELTPKVFRSAHMRGLTPDGFPGRRRMAGRFAGRILLRGPEEEKRELDGARRPR